jgi:hypothetical protein
MVKELGLNVKEERITVLIEKMRGKAEQEQRKKERKKRAGAITAF